MIEQVRTAALKRVEKIRSALESIDFATSGTLLERRKVCGKPGRRCTLDPSQRHGVVDGRKTRDSDGQSQA